MNFKTIVFVCWLAVLAIPVSAKEYSAGQMGMYEKLCASDSSGALCTMYLAGYRAGLYDQQQKTVETENLKAKYCSESYVPAGLVAMCKMKASELSMSMMEGCNNEGANLSANVVSAILSNYVSKNPSSLDRSFGEVYADAMSESFPCRK